MVAAALVRQEPEPAPGEILARARTAQMNDGGEVLFFLEGR